MGFAEAATQQALAFPACTTSGISVPRFPGVSIHKLEANFVTGISQAIFQGEYIGHGPKAVENINFCNVSLEYSYDGHKHSPVNVQVWLPPEDLWNERLMGVGGGGFAGGLSPLSYSSMKGAVDDGYVTVSTDGGHSSVDTDPANWALDNSGKVDMHRLDNFVHRTYDTMTDLAKSFTKTLYGRDPKYSYWVGCSQGGRQGLAMAQRYPRAYNGIIANAPAVNWAALINTIYWPQFVLNSIKEYPKPCELEAVTAAAIQECDLDDGVQDRTISDPDACRFRAQTLEGTEIECNGRRTKISKAAVKVAQAFWDGPTSEDGQILWYGFPPDAELTGQLHAVTTECDNDGTCKVVGFQLSNQWLQWFIAKDGSYDLTAMTHRDFESMFNTSLVEYDRMLSTNNPDLSEFRDAGGKMITVHGIADQLIPVKSTQDYYGKVLAADANASQYYRYFEAPGMAHCFTGRGGIPESQFDALVAWVEHGIAPEQLIATAIPEIQGISYQRPICQYPLVARYDGSGNVSDPASFYCAESHLSQTPIAKVVRRTKRLLEEAMEKTGLASSSGLDRDEL